MAIAQLLLDEYTLEMANTRKLLERFPDDQADWRSDAKSNPIAWVAGHVADLPRFAVTVLQNDSFDFGGGPLPERPKTRETLLAHFDRLVEQVRNILPAVSDEAMGKPWTLSMQGKVLFTMPRYMALRIMGLNHLMHHRSQLCVYYRMLGVPVPALYGPSADEGF